MINLFEYKNKIPFESSMDDLEGFLDTIWNNREKSGYYNSEEDNDKIESQRFLQFLHKTREIKSNKYVGVIHFNGQKINLLPKIFYEEGKTYSRDEINQIQNHILWWLSYCRKIKFPNYQTAIGNTQSDFFEVLIYLFSKYTRELLTNSIYQQYEEINRELSFIKGRLNTTAYIRENVSKGRWHHLNCTFDAFVFDNEFNRIIKYVTNLLFQVTQNQDNKKNLREILFIFDEVSDEPATAEQCAHIHFNPMFSDFETVRDYCYLFLSNAISFDYKNDLKLFAFLLPMEYVFEDFVFGFIDKELENIKAKAQKSNTYLDTGNLFNLKPDLWIKTATKSLIADTKYKIVYENENDPKKGISQNDLYQMVAYAIRFDVDTILLFYPNTINSDTLQHLKLEILDELANGRKITIETHELPIINHDLLQTPLKPLSSLNEIFEESKVLLIERLESILLPYL